MALHISDSNSSSNILVSIGNVFEDEEHSLRKRSLRDNLHRYLNKIQVHTAIVIIVLVQLLITTFLLLIHYEVIQDPDSTTSDKKNSHTNHTVKNESTVNSEESNVDEVEDALNSVNIIIFSLFVVEIILRVIASGSNIVQDKLQILDGLLVVIVCILYISILAAGTANSAAYIIAYLIVFRLWRIARIYYDIKEHEKRKAERILNSYRKAAKDAENNARSMLATIEQQKYEIVSLRQKLQMLHTNSSPAMRSVSQDTPTTDDPCTSEDECDRPEEGTNQVLEMVTVELSNNQLPHTPNGSLPSGTPNGSVPNMTPTSSCSYLTGDGADADKMSNKFPDLVEQAQGIKVKDTVVGQGQSYDTFPNSGEIDTQGVTKKQPGNNNEMGMEKSTVVPQFKQNDLSSWSKTKNEETVSHSNNGQYAYHNAAFQSDIEVPNKDATQKGELTESKAATPGEVAQLRPPSHINLEDFGSTTYLNQEGIPMTDL